MADEYFMMTDELREQVVDLLRCAADLCVRGSYAPLFDAYDEMGCPPESQVADLAAQAVVATDQPMSVEQMLEAAQRCEEGSWP